MQDESTAPAFSPDFERYVQTGERIEAPPRRMVVRRVPCLMPDCDGQARRANRFQLCANHLLMIWHHVEGERFGNYEKARGDWNLTPVPPHVVTHEEVEARRLAARQKLRRLAAAKGSLYVLDTCNGLVKIGWTGRDIYQRLIEYPPMFRLIVDVPGTRTDERDIHRSLKLSRVQGREWYEPTPEVVRQINQWIAERNMRSQQIHSDVQAESPRVAREDSRAIALPRFTTLAEWKGTVLRDYGIEVKPTEKLTTHRA